MKIVNLWDKLIAEGYTQIFLYDGPSPSGDLRIVVLLDEHGGEIAHRTTPTDDKSWKMAGISHLKGFSELPEETLAIQLTGDPDKDLMALILAESAGRPKKMEKPHFYR